MIILSVEEGYAFSCRRASMKTLLRTPAECERNLRLINQSESIRKTMKFLVPLLASSLTLSGISLACAQICTPPPAVSTTDINADTSASIKAFRGLIAVADGKMNFKTTVHSLFVGNPNAIQWYATLSFYYDGCVVIRDSHDLSPSERLTLLLQLRQSLMPFIELVPVLSTSPGASGVPPKVTPSGSANQHGMNMIPEAEPARMFLAADIISDPVTGKLTWAEKYLRPVPTVVTRGNQYWVDVGSAKSESVGRNYIAELKQKFPTCDFALYHPYGRSTIWNIVIASWVSKEEAEEIVIAAREKINDTSFVWRACSAMNGDECVPNRKFFLSTELKSAPSNVP